MTCTADGALLLSTDFEAGSSVRTLLVYIAALSRTVAFSALNNAKGQGGGKDDVLLMDEARTLVLKLTNPSPWAERVGASHREVCIYKSLTAAGVAWAPQVLCSSYLSQGGGVILMSHAGDPVSSANLPADYQAQAHRIFADMRALKIAHNDIVKMPVHRTDPPYMPRSRVPGGAWEYITPWGGLGLEVMVRNSSLILIDYNWATINGSFNCAGDKKLPLLPHWLKAVRPDGLMLLLLHELEYARQNASHVPKPVNDLMLVNASVLRSLMW